MSLSKNTHSKIKGSVLLATVLLSTSTIADHISVSSNIMNFDYKEYSPSGKLLDSENSSNLMGFTAAYSNNFFGNNITSNKTALFVKASLYGGNTKYVGSALGSNNAYGTIVSTTQDQLFNGKIGIRQYNNFNFISFYSQLGVGYRYWDRKISNQEDEKYKWAYLNVKIGVIKHFFYTSNSIGITASYNKALSPKLKANIRGVTNSTFNLGNTYGYSFSVPYTYAFDNGLNGLAINVSYTYQRWHISRSNTIGQLEEPRSTTIQNIGKIGLSYSF